jgi:hypothetical protein
MIWSKPKQKQRVLYIFIILYPLLSKSFFANLAHSDRQSTRLVLPPRGEHARARMDVNLA